MNTNQLKVNIINILTILILFFSMNALVFADKEHEYEHHKHSHGNKGKKGLVQPDGFEKLVLYMGNGIFDPAVSEPRPGVTGCGPFDGLFCDGDFFQYEIMNRSDAEILEIENAAKAHFLEFFGIDVDDPAMADRISFSMFMVNPDFQYRVHALSEEHVPSEGWIIRDGGFSLAITDPDGITLGGKSAGIHASQGAGGFFGNYNILTTDKHGNAEDELIIHYASQTPTVPLPNGDIYFKCAMFNDEWGEGIGMGIMNFKPLEDGRIRGNVRNVLTFAPASTVEYFPPTPAFDEKP
jgi:hypothetical protein